MPAPRWNLVALAAGALALLAGGPWLYAHVRSLPGAEPLAARADQRILVLEVRAAATPAAADSLRAALRATPGVTAAEVRPAQARAYVVCEHSLADTALVAAARAVPAGRDARLVSQ